MGISAGSTLFDRSRMQSELKRIINTIIIMTSDYDDIGNDDNIASDYS